MKTLLSVKILVIVLVTTLAMVIKPLPAHADWGYCTDWAAQQFSRNAPTPGCNWNGNAQDWVGAAKAKGWATTDNPTSAIPGAVVVWSGGIYGHVAYVTGVNANGISISEMNFGPIWTDYKNGKTNYFGIPTNATLSWAKVSQRTSSLSFVGYILPSRQGQLHIPVPALTSNPVPLLRYYNPNSGDHFYTVDRSGLGQGNGGYQLEKNEGGAFNTQVSGTCQLFQLFNSNTGKHFYTISRDEGDSAVRYAGYHYEDATGIFVFPYNTNPIVGPPYTTPLYRYYNISDGGHFYTAHDQAILGTNPNQNYGSWHYEMIQCWILP